MFKDCPIGKMYSGWALTSWRSGDVGTLSDILQELSGVISDCNPLIIRILLRYQLNVILVKIFVS